MAKRRKLTPEENQVRLALKSIWEEKKALLKLNQLTASVEMGFSSQSSVSQYLNGNIPLNTNAKIKFAKFLGISVLDFDPGFDSSIPVGERNKIMSRLGSECADLTEDEAAKVEAFVKGLKSAR